MLLNNMMLFNNSSRAIRWPDAEARVDLRKRRKWFDGQQDDGGEDGPDKDQQKPKNQPDEKYKPDDLDEAVRIIRALERRLSERDATNNDLNERLTAIEDAQKKRLEADGNFQELLKQANAQIAELKPQADRSKTLEEIIRESNKKRIEKIPEDRRAIIPVDDLSPERLQTWLDRSEPLLTKPPAPNFDGGAGKGSGGSPEPALTDEERSAAKLFGLKDEDMLKAKEKLSVQPDTSEE